MDNFLDKSASDLSGMAKESLGIRLVKSLEEHRGCKLQVSNRRQGFNGLSIYQGDVIRKIELKTVINSDNWFAINGLYGIESLFFDSQYYIYFALIREQKIVIAPGLPFLQAQIPGYNPEIGHEVQDWISLTKSICTNSGLNIIPRVNFKLRIGIRALINQVENNQEVEYWKKCVDSIWSCDHLGHWSKTFPSD